MLVYNEHARCLPGKFEGSGTEVQPILVVSVVVMVGIVEDSTGVDAGCDTTVDKED